MEVQTDQWEAEVSLCLSVKNMVRFTGFCTCLHKTRLVFLECLENVGSHMFSMIPASTFSHCDMLVTILHSEDTQPIVLAQKRASHTTRLSIMVYSKQMSQMID